MYDFSNLIYLPVIEVRPAEMLALQELPNKDKDRFCPLFKLRPWVGSINLSSSVERLKSAYGARPGFLEVGEEEVVESRRDVHDELDSLRESDDGYKNWHEFLMQEENRHFIPAIQTLDVNQFGPQIDRLYSLGRGLLLRLDSTNADIVEAAAKELSGRTSGGENTVILLDYGKQGSDFQHDERGVRRTILGIKEHCPGATVAISASSFPSSFTAITEQDIFERLLFDKVSDALNSHIVYSDRGSARAVKQLGGGGRPAPRIDYALKKKWVFFRQDGGFQTFFPAYQRQARLLMQSDIWDNRLRLWGTQMIEKTAHGDKDGGISSPNRSTAVRINLHIHRQLHYDDQGGFYDTDEEWTD